MTGTSENGCNGQKKKDIIRRKKTSERGVSLQGEERIDMQTIDQALDKLEHSTFRSSFHLTKKERAYLSEKGMECMKSHAEDFVRQKLAPADPVNDGKQTPMHGHPVFKAMHATACCCRGCLNKWYRVPKGKELTEEEQRKIVNLLMAWLERQMKTGGS